MVQKEGSITLINLEEGYLQYFWHQGEAYSAGIPAGTYVTQVTEEEFKNNPTGQPNLLLRSNSVNLRYGTRTDLELSSSGIKIAKGGLEAGTFNSDDYVYAWSENRNDRTISINSSGNKNDWRFIAGKKFGVDKAGNLYAENVHISGTVTVGAGSNVYTTDDVNPLWIGSRNLFAYGSACDISTDGFYQTTDNKFTIATEDSTKCAKVTGQLNKTAYIGSKIDYTPQPLEWFTCSLYVKLKNVTAGTTNPLLGVYFGGETVEGAWRGVQNVKIVVDGTTLPTGKDQGRFDTYINDSKWHKVEISAQYQNYPRTGTYRGYVYARDFTGDMFVHHVKWERGNKATDWSPAPEEVQIEIDAKKSTHTLNTNYSYTYSQILTYSAEGYSKSDGWTVTDATGVKAGDTVRMKVLVSDMSDTPVYIIGTVSEVRSNTLIIVTSHGLDTTVIDGGKILTNSIGANQIKANSIGAKHITISDSTNLAQANEGYPESLTNAGSVSAPVISGGYLTKANTSYQYLPVTSLVPNNFKQNDEIYYEFYGKSASTSTVNVGFWGYNSSKNYICYNGSANHTLTTTEAFFSGTFKLTSGYWSTDAKYYWLGINDTSASKVQISIRKLIIRRKNGGELIVDGSITIGKLAGDAKTDMSLIADANAPTLTKVEGINNRYFSDGSSYRTAEMVAISDPPEPWIQYGGRITSTGTQTTDSQAKSALVHYGYQSGYEIPMSEGETYTLSFWARKVSGTCAWYCQVGSGPYLTKNNSNTYRTYNNLGTAWTKITYTFTYTTALCGGAGKGCRVYPGIVFKANTAGVGEVCGVKLYAGALEDGLESGRNILSGTIVPVSKATTATSSYVTQHLYYTPNKAMLSELGYIAGEALTLSFDWKITNATTYGNARIEWYGKTSSADDTYIAPLINPFATFSATNTSGHVETTVLLTSATVQSRRMIVRIDNSNLTLTISNLKLERGSKATRWSAAPEDIDDASKVATDYVTKIDNAGIFISPSNQSPTDTAPGNSIRLDGTGLNIYKDGTSVAFYGDTARIGKVKAAHSVIDADGQRFYASNGTTQLANIGYGSGASTSGTAIAPYYSFGSRIGTIGNWSVAEGWQNTASGFSSHAEGGSTKASGPYSHAEGYNTTASEQYSHAEGYGTIASYHSSHAEGSNTTASSWYSHAEGSNTIASGNGSHAEGYGTVASGEASHAEGTYAYTEGNSSHAEGYGTSAYGDYSHAEGKNASAVGNYSHAEGYIIRAVGDYSHAQNLGTNAGYSCQTVIGKYNSNLSDTALEIGKGSDDSNRSNAMIVKWTGHTTIAGTLTQSSDKRLKKHKYYLSGEAVEFIRSLKPVHYIKDDENHVGFYAQEVEKVDPYNCMIGEMNGYKTLGYTELIAPLVAYCQSLEKRIEELEDK